jgi:hypothetical protein
MHRKCCVDSGSHGTWNLSLPSLLGICAAVGQGTGKGCIRPYSMPYLTHWLHIKETVVRSVRCRAAPPVFFFSAHMLYHPPLRSAPVGFWHSLFCYVLVDPGAPLQADYTLNISCSCSAHVMCIWFTCPRKRKIEFTKENKSTVIMYWTFLVHAMLKPCVFYSHVHEK